MSRIRHIAITTKDVARLVKFYTTVFGLKIVPGRGTGTYLSDGHVNLAILPLEPERETERPCLKEGFYHFGFQVDDVDALRPISKHIPGKPSMVVENMTGAGSIVAANHLYRVVNPTAYDRQLSRFPALKPGLGRSRN